MAKIKALEARPTEAEKDPSQRDYKFWKTQPVPQYGKHVRRVFACMRVQRPSVRIVPCNVVYLHGYTSVPLPYFDTTMAHDKLTVIPLHHLLTTNV